MSEIELAWAAGFFDGEGSTSCSPKIIKGRNYLFLCMQLSQVGELMPETLQRFRDAVGIGKIYGPYQPATSTRQPVWKWQVQAESDVKAVVEKLKPYLSEVKVAQATYCLYLYDNRVSER